MDFATSPTREAIASEISAMVVCGRRSAPPGNGAADLLGLADQVVALMRDVLEQGADADFVAGTGALGSAATSLATSVSRLRRRARSRLLDAVASGRRDLAAAGPLPTVTMESDAEPSGSEKRIATCAIACAT